MSQSAIKQAVLRIPDDKELIEILFPSMQMTNADLISIFRENHNERLTLRKAINKKDHASTYMLEEMKLSPEISMYDFVRERMIFGMTMYPNFKGAFRLVQHVNSLQV